MSHIDKLNLIKSILEKYNGNSNYLEKYIQSKDVEIKIKKFKITDKTGQITEYDYTKILYEVKCDQSETKEWTVSSPYELIISDFKNNITFTDPDIFYYSSYIDMDIDKFKSKELAWMSENFDQAFLHIFEGERYESISKDELQPKIYRFQLKKIQIINSQDHDNTNIFDNILEDVVINEIKKALGVKKFITEDNKYILYILMEFNKLVSDKYKIYGYRNKYDQIETALIDFNNILLRETIKESKYVSYKTLMKNFSFPICKTDWKNIIHTSYKDSLYPYERNSTIPLFPHRYRMFSEYYDDEITYQDFDSLESIIYKIKPLEEYFKKKYLKYKQKYIQLKSL